MSQIAAHRTLILLGLLLVVAELVLTPVASSRFTTNVGRDVFKDHTNLAGLWVIFGAATQGVVFFVLVIIFNWAFFSPHIFIPVISETICFAFSLITTVVGAGMLSGSTAYLSHARNTQDPAHRGAQLATAAMALAWLLIGTYLCLLAQLVGITAKRAAASGKPCHTWGLPFGEDGDGSRVPMTGMWKFDWNDWKNAQTLTPAWKRPVMKESTV